MMLLARRYRVYAVRIITDGYLLDAGWHTNLPQFQGARSDHVRVESSSFCYTGRLGVSEF